MHTKGLRGTIHQKYSQSEEITGYKSAYRMRSGDYRIGVIIEDNIVTFVAFAHRKEIYRKFP